MTENIKMRIGGKVRVLKWAVSRWAACIGAVHVRVYRSSTRAGTYDGIAYGPNESGHAHRCDTPALAVRDALRDLRNDARAELRKAKRDLDAANRALKGGVR